jgi:hypothetical protein
MRYVYLHGFGSSPNSGKARYLAGKFQELRLQLDVPDLNLGDFTSMTISRVLAHLQAVYAEPVSVIGSSLGGYIGLLWAQQSLLVQKLLLLAPAIAFPRAIAEWLGNQAIQQWQELGYYEFWHYETQKPIPLSYEFFKDAQSYTDQQFDRAVPTVILHGRRDEVVPVQVSENFAQSRPYVDLHLVDSDHSLGDSPTLNYLWQLVSERIL